MSESVLTLTGADVVEVEVEVGAGRPRHLDGQGLADTEGHA